MEGFSIIYSWYINSVRSSCYWDIKVLFKSVYYNTDLYLILITMFLVDEVWCVDKVSNVVLVECLQTTQVIEQVNIAHIIINHVACF